MLLKNRKYESRVSVKEVTFEAVKEKLIPHIKIELKDDDDE